jgi:PIN domain nuclease of toxin-antitoxin system
MKLLLDTHCLIWALADAPALSAAARAAMARAEEVAFSEASVWEIGLKWRKGKINLQPRRVVEQALRDGFRMCALSLEPILLSCELKQKHGDPFDRLLYAQAKHLGYRLLTIDRRLSEFGAHVISPR